MTTEEMLKKAFERQAERAPDHARLLASVGVATGTRRRSRPVGYALIAAGVAAAVAVPVVVFGTSRPPDTSAVNPMPATSATTGPQVSEQVYGPAWLPDGMNEWSRNWWPDGSVIREWRTPVRNGETVKPVSLTVSTVRSQAPPEQPPKTVEVNGRPGLASPGRVEWRAADGKWLTVRADSRPDPEVMRIARSVRQGAPVVLTRPVEFGWTPPGLEPGPTFMKPDGDSWTAAVRADMRGAPNTPRLSAEILPAWEATGTPVTVRGKQGQYRAVDENAGEVWTRLEDGRVLKVTGWFGQDVLVRVADEVRVVADLPFP